MQSRNNEKTRFRGLVAIGSARRLGGSSKLFYIIYRWRRRIFIILRPLTVVLYSARRGNVCRRQQHTKQHIQ